MKERLVGAAVLMAAAVVLIPEMLSGPKRSEQTAARRQGDESFKTFTIDLNRSPGAPVATPIEERAPPPETEPTTSEAQKAPNDASDAPAPIPTAPSAADSESTSGNPPSRAQASPESASTAPASQPAPRRDSQPAQRPQTPPGTRTTSPPAAVASTPSVPTSKGWAIQLGSFASKATADRMAREFSESGQSAFVMPVKSGANTLYRVRIGPFAERADANAALAGVRKRVANAAVVAHP